MENKAAEMKRKESSRREIKLQVSGVPVRVCVCVCVCVCPSVYGMHVCRSVYTVASMYV